MPIFNQDIARAVTMGGRVSNKYVGVKMDELYSTQYNHKNLLVAGDTDSVVGDSVLNLRNKDIEYTEEIQKFYDVVAGDIETRDESNFIKHINEDIYSASVNKRGELEYRKVNYVMKHKVKKKLYKISANGKSVTVTEDHSIIVKRDGNLISAKPTELKNSDKIITL